MAVTKDQLIIEIAANTDKAASSLQQLVTLADDFKNAQAELSAEQAKQAEVLKQTTQATELEQLKLSAVFDEQVTKLKVLGDRFDRVTAARMEAARALQDASGKGDDFERQKATIEATMQSSRVEINALAIKESTLKSVGVLQEQLQVDELKRSGDAINAIRLQNQIELRAFDDKVNGLAKLGDLRADEIKLIDQTRQAIIKQGEADVAAAEMSAQQIANAEAMEQATKAGVLEQLKMSAAFDEQVGRLRILGDEFDQVTASRIEAARAMQAANAVGNDFERQKAVIEATRQSSQVELNALALKERTLKQVGSVQQQLQIDELKRNGRLIDAIKLENQIELQAFDDKVKGLKAVGKLRSDEIKLIDQTRAAMVRQGDAKVSDAGKSIAGPKAPGGDFGGAFLKIGAVVGTATAAFYAFKKILDSTVGEFQKSEDEILKLSNALRLMGETNVGASVERFKELAKSLQDTTTVSDEHVMSLASVGVAAGKTDAQIEKLIKASIDLAGATGRDVDTTFQALLNTYKGVARGITDIVPELQGMTAAQLRNGDAVDYVNTKMQGFGQAVATTFAGKLTQAQNTISDVAEVLGATISSAFDIDSVSSSFVTSLREMRDYLEENAAAIAGAIAAVKTVFANFFNFILAGTAKIIASFAGLGSMLAGIGEYLGMPGDLSKSLEKVQADERKRAQEYWGNIKSATDEGTKAVERFIKTSQKSAKAPTGQGGRPKPPAMVSPEARGQLQELIKLRAQLDLQAKHADDNQIEAIFTKAAAEKLQVDELKKKLQLEGAYGAKAKENYNAILAALDARANGEADKKRLDALNKERDITDRLMAASAAAGATQAMQLKTARDAQIVQINLKEDEARRQGLITQELMQQYNIQRDIAGKVYDDQITQLARQSTFMGGIVDDAREYYSLMSEATGVMAKKAGDGLEKSLVAAIAAARNLLEIAAPKKEEAGPPKSASATADSAGFISKTMNKAAEQWDAFSSKIAAAQEQKLSMNMESISGGLADAGGAIGGATLGIIAAVAQAPAAILGGLDAITGVIDGLVQFPEKLINALTNLDQLLSNAIDKLPGAIDKMLDKLPQLLTSIIKKIPDFIIMLSEKIPEIIAVLAETLPELVSIVLSRLPAIVSGIAKGIAKAVWELITGLVRGIGNVLKGVKMPQLVDTQKIGKDLSKEIKKLTGAASKLFDVTDMGKAAANSVGGPDIAKQIRDATTKAGMNLSIGWKNMMTALGRTWHDVLKAFDISVSAFQDAADIVGRVMSDSFKVIWQTGEQLFNIAKQILLTVWGSGREIFDVVAESFAAVWDIGKELFASIGNVFGAIWDAGRTMFDAVAAVFGALWNVLASIFDGWQATQNAIINLWRTLFESVQVIFTAIWSVGQALFDFVVTIFESIWSVGRVLFDAVAGVFAVAWEAGNKVVGLFTEGFESIWRGFSAVWAMFWDGFQEIWSLGEQAFIKIKEILDPLTGTLGDWFDKTVKFFKELDLASLGTKLWDALKKGLEGSTEIFTNLGTKIWDGLKGGLDNVGNVLGKLFKFDGGGKGTVENFIGMDFPFVAFSKGGLVPGAASVPGDSMSNDVVPALLSPGEVVLPRSALGDEAFRRIVMMKLAGQEIPQFARGGLVNKWVGDAKKTGGEFAEGAKNLGGQAAEAAKDVVAEVAEFVVPDWIKNLYDSVKRFVPSIDITKVVQNPAQEISNALKSVVNTTLAPFIKQVLVKPMGFADGGIVGSTDTIPAMLTPGEFVLQKSAVDSLGVPTLKALNAGAGLPSGAAGPTVVNVTLNIESRQAIDESFIRQRVIPVIKDEFKRSSLDGRAIVYASGVRK